MFSKALLKIFIVMLILIPASLSAQQLFIKNVGQWDCDIMYSGSGEGYKIVIARSGIYINHQQVNKAEENQDEFGNKINEVLFSSDNIRLNFVSSNIEDNIMENIISGKLSSITAEFWNYGPNSDWYWDVPCYEEIVISDIYPDISMKFYYESNNIRYDFELGASANSNEIKMLVQGAQSSEIIDNELIIKTKLGEIRNGKIKTFINSNGEEIPTSIKMNKTGEIQFDLAQYNKEDKITIDPLVYASYVYNPIKLDANYSNYDFVNHEGEYWLVPNDYLYQKQNLYDYTDTLYHNMINYEINNYGNILVYNQDLNKIKRLIFTGNNYLSSLVFKDDYLFYFTGLSREAQSFHSVNKVFDTELCILKINYKNRTIDNGIALNRFPIKMVIDSKNRIVLTYGYQNGDDVLTENAFYSGCDSAYSKDCKYPHFAVINEKMDSILYSTLIPYSNKLIAYDVIDPGLLIDSKDNIYIIGRVNDHFIDNYDNIIGEIYSKKVGINSSNIITSVHKFDKDFNFIKSTAIIFSLTAHCLINSNDDLILIGNVHSGYRDYFKIHEDCINQENETWDFSRAGFMMIDKDLNYLRSGIMPGDAINDFFNIIGPHYLPPNGGSAATLDKQDNIYLVSEVPYLYSSKYPLVNEKSYKAVQTGENYFPDIGITKISSDLTKILYSTVYGGSYLDASGHIDVQDSVVTIVGVTNSFDLFMTNDANIFYRTSEEYENMFVLKIVNTLTTVEDSPKDKPYIYPNPAYSYIELPESLTKRYSQYSIHDLPGRTLVTKRLQDYRIDISTLPRGTYNLVLTNTTNMVSYLFVKTE
ncbi:MAG: T9SS type A sorting domain-containing protein [Candidatus Kapabacteria bacterium]|nr:T9SS type A sorting domain-containing protein [Candidatus Kapabacteria bacterium]